MRFVPCVSAFVLVLSVSTAVIVSGPACTPAELDAWNPPVCEPSNPNCTCLNPSLHWGCVDNWVNDLVDPNPLRLAPDGDAGTKGVAPGECQYPTKHMGCADEKIKDLKGPMKLKPTS